MKLEGKVAVVTGGTRGIGRGVTEAFLAEGATVVMAGRSEEKGKQALEELDAGDRAAFRSCDVRSREGVKALIDSTVEEFGRIDILVNNAGGSDGFAPIHELADEAWDKAMDLNVNSAFWATRAAVAHMLPQSFGRIINMSSVESKLGNKASVSHYITSKHALNGLTKATAFEYGTNGITCNALCPGAIETDLMTEVGPGYAAENGMTYEEYKNVYAAESAIKRLNTVEEVGAMAVLLASDVGGGITGALINIDGGTAPY
ncbi:SDR family NAD(P)-dependent oxidoreductase [Nocardioides marmoribigeumensis]|jgi:3-hydroxybutyrate dehydrogenase/3-oxoacyl-[acyl-carrier protein] reductase|uniref:3-hydroxybutyrate dehydrogenase/3-oxoacyl-[acyl-carrier protein] reductase n=1 Tax=Nocardioides marmoribigeumensis TaxID=433649 RepID=A0ABU2BXX4_9ACTN|nr:SDR family NAD(P)-dependent oxidoreductase [Nocardioides marmoribigeumensis]MDR7363259.1 3-hydroxybutyrate dehydrogenase/3-oxoacyl-[acyl-carrier protein] reductase [Nocardioides marmoribigeumensis]